MANMICVIAPNVSHYVIVGESLFNKEVVAAILVEGDS